MAQPSKPEQSAVFKEHWQQVEELFHRASQLPPGDRTEVLREWCSKDPALLAELLSLLESDSSVEDLLAAAPPVTPANFLARETAGTEDPMIGKIVGAFRLDSLLGRGGMGVVYLATRLTKDLSQKAAIKLMARHLQSTPAQEQFVLEIAALARLEHPNISRLLDGGVTTDGVTYVAMEYIEGQRLDNFCDHPDVSVEQVMRLMLQLCSAVDYVHRNLILHRDLKPANVMVTDDGATVKLLDFGTLKLMSLDPAASSMMTQAGMRPITMRYASPEHIRGDLASTASDVYSLGMILYRLIAGRLPPGLDDLRIDQYVARLESHPITPPGQLPPAPSGQIASKRLTRAMAKDLDAIMLKALRFDPDERYSGVDTVAADISRALENRPVLAQTPTALYRAQRFCKRNLGAVLGSIAAVALLATGLVAIRWQAKIAAAQTQRAEAGIEDERKLAHLLFTDYFQELKRIPGSTDAQREAVTQAISYLDNLSAITDNQKLRLDSAEAYRRMALLQGDPYEQNIGDPNGALASLNKAEIILTSLKSFTPNNTGVLAALALTQRTRSEVLFGIGKTQEGVASMRAAVAFYDALVARPGATVAQLQLASNAYNGLGDELGQPGSASLGDHEAALNAFRKDIQLSERALVIDPKYDLARQSIAIAHNKIGQILVGTDPYAAIDAYRQSLTERNNQPAAERNNFRNRRGTGVNYWDLGGAFMAARDEKSAIDAFEQGRAIIEAYALADPKDIRAQHDLSVGLCEEALVYLDVLDPRLNPATSENQKDRTIAQQQATALLERSIAIQEHILSISPNNQRWTTYLAYAQVLLGTLKQKSTGSQKEGHRLATIGITALNKLASANDLTIEQLDYAVEAMLAVQPSDLLNNQLTEAAAEHLVTLDHRTSPDHLLLLAEAYRNSGESEKAATTARDGLALLAAPVPGRPIPRTRHLLELLITPHP